jgi:hypothetical protein
VRPTLCAIAAATAVLAAMPASAAASSGRCTHKHSKTMKSTGKVRVFSIPNHSYYGRRVYACLRSNGYRHRLGMNAEDFGYEDWVGVVRIRGTAVAWTSGWATRYGEGGDNIDAVDLTAPRRRHHAAGYYCSESFVDIVVTPRASLAWTDQAGTSPECEGDTNQVRKLDGDGVAVVDRSDAIDVRSLRWSRGRVRWAYGDGTRHSAPLP